MLSICIGYGKRDAQWLTLPTDRSEVYEAIGKIMEENGWEQVKTQPYIRDALSEIPNLPSYLEGYYYSIPEAMAQLNFLAARIAWLSTKEKEIFSKALEILEPSTLRQLIETTFDLDQFEIQSGTIIQKSDKEWNHVLDNEEIYNKPFGKDVAFFLHVHRESGPGYSSFALRLPQKEKVWDRFEVWVDSDKPSKVKTIQCGGQFGELWDYLPANSTWKEIDDFAELLMSQELKNPTVFIAEMISCFEAERPHCMEDVFRLASGLKGSTVSQDIHKIRLFSPLEGELFTYNERGRIRIAGYPLEAVDLIQFQESIKEVLHNEEWLKRHPCGFVEQLENKLLRQKVISMRPMTEEWNGRLWGVLEVKSYEELQPEELGKVIEQWRGLAAAGWGYQIRNMGIKTEIGELHLSFWSSHPDFCILTEGQLKENRLAQSEDQSQGLTMG